MTILENGRQWIAHTGRKARLRNLRRLMARSQKERERMGSGNGTNKNFEIPQGIPIIGQPFELQNGYITALGYCKCGGTKTAVLLPGGPGACPSCQRTWIVTGALFDLRTGQLQITVGLMQAPPASADPATGPTP